MSTLTPLGSEDFSKWTLRQIYSYRFFYQSIQLTRVFEYDCLGICCFGCLICMCFAFWYLHSALLKMFHMENRSRNVFIITIINWTVHNNYNLWIQNYIKQDSLLLTNAHTTVSPRNDNMRTSFCSHYSRFDMERKPLADKALHHCQHYRWRHDDVSCIHSTHSWRGAGQAQHHC